MSMILIMDFCADDELCTWNVSKVEYLPDGGIAFVSTRCQSFGRCHGGRYTPAYFLYRMDGDGKNIRPLSYGEANEWDPSVLADGRIIYTRWDYTAVTLAVFGLVLSANRLGDWLRDRLDPTLSAA